jgi:aldose 1-epimerase
MRKASPTVETSAFGSTPDGTAVDLFTLSNGRGAAARIASYGATVVSLQVPDRDGRLDDVVLGFDTLDGYLHHPRPYFGAICGRYANRIRRGQFTLDGREHVLARNDGENHLHGGKRGFDKVVWKARPLPARRGAGVELSYRSPDGEEGYPGNLDVRVTYALTGENALRIDYRATTDRPTLVNLTHHSYFNLDGAGRGDVLAHVLAIRAGRFTPVVEGLIPTGELRSVRGTPMDFTRPTAIGARIDSGDEQLAVAGGYDHNFVLGRTGARPSLAARLASPATGRVMEVLTTEPGVQLYSGNFLDGTVVGKGGRAYGHRFAVCLETQHFPDSPNQPGFPSTVLRPGETYRSTTIYRFSVASAPVSPSRTRRAARG